MATKRVSVSAVMEMSVTTAVNVVAVVAAAAMVTAASVPWQQQSERRWDVILFFVLLNY